MNDTFTHIQQKEQKINWHKKIIFFISYDEFFTRVWVTAIIICSPGLFSLFKPILTKLWFGWSRIFPWFLVRLFFSQAFEDSSERTNYDWYHRHFHVPQHFSSLTRFKYLSNFSLSFISSLCDAINADVVFYKHRFIYGYMCRHMSICENMYLYVCTCGYIYMVVS